MIRGDSPPDSLAARKKKFQWVRDSEADNTLSTKYHWWRDSNQADVSEEIRRMFEEADMLNDQILAREKELQEEHEMKADVTKEFAKCSDQKGWWT